jgi:hypothetical protein
MIDAKAIFTLLKLFLRAGLAIGNNENDLQCICNAYVKDVVFWLKEFMAYASALS